MVSPYEEYYDVDSNIDQLFMYYLQERAFNIDSMVDQYFSSTGEEFPLYDDNQIFLNKYKEIYQKMLYSELPTRLTDIKTKDYLNYIKYNKSYYYNNLVEISLNRLDLGKNLIRDSIIHWNLFLENYLDCNFEWLVDCSLQNNVTLENFYCPYDDDLIGISTATIDYNTYLNEFVIEMDKQKKEIIDFKLFLKDYPAENANLEELKDDFYNDLVSDSIFSHNKSNVISRLVSTKRWKRRVEAKNT